jgi:hypothetical protein
MRYLLLMMGVATLVLVWAMWQYGPGGFPPG